MSADTLPGGIPRDPAPDATLALLRDGYDFIPNRCRRLGTDAFETRLALKTVVCAAGRDAAEMFYGGDRFTRQGAMPPTTVRLLQDQGSVQQLDADAHRRRKAMFMTLMTPAALDRMGDLFEERWQERIAPALDRGSVVLHDAAREVLTRAVCDWAGVPLPEPDVPRRAHELGAMIDGAGRIGPVAWFALLLRERDERWVQRVIRSVRAHEVELPEHLAAQVIAFHEDDDGRRLEEEVAAVELINVLRPTVAIARFIVFSALALHEHPDARALVRGGEADVEAFVQEVRRFYPFFPFVGGKVRQPFEWRDRRFETGDWVLLDLYGTNRDARIWDAPAEFRPERFRNREPGAFELVPQGAGDHHTGHRCPGEWLTIEVMKRAVRRLAETQYAVPEQDLHIDLSRIPALPASGFVIERA